MTTSNNNLNFALSALAAPDFASSCFAETKHAMPPLKENADARGNSANDDRQAHAIGIAGDGHSD